MASKTIFFITILSFFVRATQCVPVPAGGSSFGIASFPPKEPHETQEQYDASVKKAKAGAEEARQQLDCLDRCVDEAIARPKDRVPESIYQGFGRDPHMKSIRSRLDVLKDSQIHLSSFNKPTSAYSKHNNIDVSQRLLSKPVSVIGSTLVHEQSHNLKSGSGRDIGTDDYHLETGEKDSKGDHIIERTSRHKLLRSNTDVQQKAIVGYYYHRPGFEHIRDKSSYYSHHNADSWAVAAHHAKHGNLDEFDRERASYRRRNSYDGYKNKPHGAFNYFGSPHRQNSLPLPDVSGSNPAKTHHIPHPFPVKGSSSSQPVASSSKPKLPRKDSMLASTSTSNPATSSKHQQHLNVPVRLPRKRSQSMSAAFPTTPFRKDSTFGKERPPRVPPKNIPVPASGPAAVSSSSHAHPRPPSRQNTGPVSNWGVPLNPPRPHHPSNVGPRNSPWLPTPGASTITGVPLRRTQSMAASVHSEKKGGIKSWLAKLKPGKKDKRP